MTKFVYSFNEGSKEMRDILGGKGANLAEMTKIGLPVPFGFTVSTEACNRYYAEDKEISPEIVDEIKEKLKELEQVTGKNLGDAKNPLLVSVRSGAVISMPGMMDTILNLGLNDETVEGLAKLTDNQRFAYDSYRRFIQMFSDVVMEIPKSKFDKVFDEKKAAVGAEFDVDLKAEDLKDVIVGFKKIYKEELGKDFPQKPEEQLLEAVKAVFRSWNTERAILYRKLNDISDDLGTAVNVQSMVFGNMGIHPVQVLHLLVLQLMVIRKFLVSSLLTHRVRTLLQVSELQSLLLKWQIHSLMFIRNLRELPKFLKSITKTCRTWSLQLKITSSSCFRQEMVRGLPLQL